MIIDTIVHAQPCSFGDPGCIAGAVISQVAQDSVAQFAHDVSESFGKIMASFGTFWLYIPTPDLAGGSGSDGDVVQYIRNGLIFFTAIAAVISIVIAGIKMMLSAKGQPIQGVVRGIVTLILVSAAGVPALSLLIAAGDSFSTWFVNRSSDGSAFGANLSAAVAALEVAPGGPLLVIILGVIAIIVAVIQVVLMLVRMVMLVLLAGMLPTAASFSSSEAGWAYLKKYGAWLLAFLLYKPIAAIIYGVAFALIANGVFTYNGKLDVTGQTLMNVVAGLLLMILAVVALGALMKFVVPSVGAIGGAAVGGAVAGGVAAGASGAVATAGGFRGFGGGSGGSSGAPSGAQAVPSAASAGGGAGAAGGGAAAAGAGAGAGAAGGAAAGGAAASGAAAGSAAGPVGTAVGAAAGPIIDGVAKGAGAAKDAAAGAVGAEDRG